MIVESAFFNLPDLLSSNFDHKDTFEATIAHLFSLAIFMEFNSRNVPRPFENIFIEKPYPTYDVKNKPIHSDLLVRLNGVVPTTGRHFLYGAREQNWIEIKAFFGTTRGTSTPPMTRKVGTIIRDLVRLCILPEELKGKIRQNGRYFLVVASTKPSDWLSFNRRNGERKWLIDLFGEGKSSINIDLTKEPRSLCKGVGEGFEKSNNLSIELDLRTRVFEPSNNNQKPLFWGHLIRIGNFQINANGKSLKYVDHEENNWNDQCQENLIEVRKNLLPKLTNAS